MSCLSSALLPLCRPLLPSTTARTTRAAASCPALNRPDRRGHKMRVSGQSSRAVGVWSRATGLFTQPAAPRDLGRALLPSGLRARSGRSGALGAPLRMGAGGWGALPPAPRPASGTSACVCLLGWVPRKRLFDRSVLSLKKKETLTDPSGFSGSAATCSAERFTNSVC